MNPMTTDDLCIATGGRLAGPARTVASVTTDTRELRPDCLFVALRGESFDGHRFLSAAASGGAAVALVDAVPSEIPNGLSLVVVDDTRHALGRLATFVRRRFRGTVIAVAGSNGKTGTKHLIHSALSASLRGSMSPKSFNNDIGVPVTILAADPADDFVVIEVGTNHPGEIAHLSRMAEPDVAVVTSIGAEHLEFLGDLDGVRRENADITLGLNRNGLLVTTGDDPEFLRALAGYSEDRVRFGFDPGNDVVTTGVVGRATGTDFLAGGVPFFVPALGWHSASNATAAVVVGRHLGLTDEAIRSGLAGASAPPMRLQLQRAGGVVILNDAYNANPHSMRSALQTLRDTPATGRRIAVLGDMRELGATAGTNHADVGRFAAECAVDQLWCVGRYAETVAGAAALGPERTRVFADAATAADEIPDLLADGDMVLVKASRGVKLEQVAEAIVRQRLDRTAAADGSVVPVER
jgi:UDP-N-acetylmuramoyl-tripeptide--D-alanyl-D-alanine ligase